MVRPLTWLTWWRGLVAGTLIASSAASPTGAQASPEIARSLAVRVAAEGSLAWSAHHLSWKDFRGRAKLGTATAAQTSSSVTYIVECHGEGFRYAVLATFSPAESWVRPDIPPHRTSSASTLKHEQTHFDITEVFARRLRRAFSTARGLCPKHPKDARKLFDRLSRESQATQNRYDDETAHGTVPEAQDRWTRAVAASLDSLGGFRQE
jgi:Bacterial protein of unknown function (DUF922)